MTVSIPSAAGVPGISGPPIWFPGEPTFDPNLDDVRWRGAVKRAFGSGTGGSNYFRATQATVGLQKFIYLTFRAAFVPNLSDTDDLIYFGLRRPGTSDAMVVRITAHPASFTPAGPPSANNPANVAQVGIWTLSGTTWIPLDVMSNPTWISQNARVWLQSSGDIGTDPNNRWGVQVRIPANTVGGITDDSGPNLGTDFDMWYLIHGLVGVAPGNPAILADYRTAGTTTQNDLDNLDYPQPSQWDEFQLTSGAATSGGVALNWGDVVVQNVAHGEGSLIDNHADNTFIARPRNYSTANINAGDINATFRIANWGSVPGDPGMPEFSTGSWDYVDGNSEINPVASGLPIPHIAAGTNPPVNAPIALEAMMDLAVPPKSLHQCILVTMNGTNINFLNDAIYQNMNYDGASLLAREAEISVVGLKSFSATPRDVYLAVEKLNMDPNRKADEGQFLQDSMKRLMRKESGELAEKLRRALSILSNTGAESKEERLQILIKVLADVGLTEEKIDKLFPTFSIHAYHDTGERVTRSDGSLRPVLREQSSFGLYAYHEGSLEGWATSIQGAQRIEENLYLIPVPNDGTAKIKVIVQAVQEGEDRIGEDPIRPIDYPKSRDTELHKRKGCLYALLKLFGSKHKAHT